MRMDFSLIQHLDICAIHVGSGDAPRGVTEKGLSSASDRLMYGSADPRGARSTGGDKSPTPVPGGAYHSRYHSRQVRGVAGPQSPAPATQGPATTRIPLVGAVIPLYGVQMLWAVWSTDRSRTGTRTHIQSQSLGC